MSLEAILSIAVALLSIGWAVLAYILSQHKTEKRSIHTRIDETNKDIAQMKAEFMRREDAQHHFNRIEQGVTQLNNRLDQFLTHLMGKQ